MEPDSCIDALTTFFVANITADPNDQFAVALQQARERLDDSPASQIVLRTLERNMRQQGPARSFKLFLQGKEIGGVAKRQSIQFVWQGHLDESLLQRVIEIVLSVSPPREELRINVEQH